ncbi:MAG: tetratricopeptide repeat protein, partial [Nitrospiria bacterium]
MSDKTFSPEIKKLMDKMAENPESRLFVPLAEEYLKSDMPDEAILVLVDGIGRHPTYVSARIMLGKIYLEKKRIMEAKSEFERVIEINPENILAHKKLALIYQEAGQPQRAIDAYQKILAVDPSDKEIKALLAKLVEEDPSTVVSDDHAPQQDSESASEPGAIHFVPTSEEVFGTTPDDVSPGTGADLDEEEAPHIELGSGIAETRPDEDLEAKDEKIFDLTEEWKSQDNIIQKDAITDDETPDAPSQIAEPISEAEPNETLATNALASLYMDQGCYQEA